MRKVMLTFAIGLMAAVGVAQTPDYLNPQKPIEERKNVASYHKENDKYIKDEISNDEYKKLSDSEKTLYFSYSGKKYKKCTRQWSYHRVRL